MGNDRAAFLAAYPVSRETLDRLDRFHELIVKENQTLSLISDSTLHEIWVRHFLDSAQLFPLILDPQKPVVDMGTGAGFPGLVLSILGLPSVHLVEHNMRKAAFLQTVIAELGLSAVVSAMKVEAIKPFDAGTVTARALKSLDTLISLGRKFIQNGGVALFPKGKRGEEELREAEVAWQMQIERFPSLTSPESVIFRLSAIEPRRRR